MDIACILDEIRALGSEKNRLGMARYGINTARAVGVGMTGLRPLAKRLGRNQAAARALWDSAVHEARILACLVADPRLAETDWLEAWVREVDSWDLCDQFCNKLVVHTAFAWPLAVSWARRSEEFVRRAGFSLAAQLAVHHKRVPDEDFRVFFSLIAQAATDERNFVKKAVNWALRQIGKRSPGLRREAVAQAQALLTLNSRSARWIARDALRELEGRPSGCVSAVEEAGGGGPPACATRPAGRLAT